MMPSVGDRIEIDRMFIVLPAVYLGQSSYRPDLHIVETLEGVQYVTAVNIVKPTYTKAAVE